MSIIVAPAFLAALAVRAGLCLLLDLVFLVGLVDSRRGDWRCRREWGVAYKRLCRGCIVSARQGLKTQTYRRELARDACVMAAALHAEIVGYSKPVQHAKNDLPSDLAA